MRFFAFNAFFITVSAVKRNNPHEEAKHRVNPVKLNNKSVCEQKFFYSCLAAGTSLSSQTFCHTKSETHTFWLTERLLVKVDQALTAFL
jgi:hypothetical protein